MVQGNLKLSSSGKKGSNNGSGKMKMSGKILKHIKKDKYTKVGSTLKLPKNGSKFRDKALEDRFVSKEIGKQAEQRTAAKLIQGGGKMLLKDLVQKGKELNKETRRSQVKKKLGRVEQKLKELEVEAISKGLV